MNLRKNGRSALLQTCHSSFVKNSGEYALKAKPEEHCAHRMCIIYIGRRWRGQDGVGPPGGPGESPGRGTGDLSQT